MTYRIEVNSKYDVTVYVTHSCGHTETYYYGSESYARTDAHYKENNLCGRCHHAYVMAQLNKLTSN
jgi:hypothetical protein